jgi:hypothetical protein
MATAAIADPTPTKLQMTVRNSGHAPAVFATNSE